ncbi:hypothetical protein [Halovivax cerinus]|uniref:Uncharacterized protein n=1 Tax=Halovivax cerinus TaxID=1487865 RepID=A0ABD5NQP8_9EURY|nr:hypothetical protein [Halovivax cerinus]
MSENGFRYEVTYDEAFEEQVRQGDVNPLCELRIVVNGGDLAGAPPGESYIDDYIFYHFRKVASAIPEVLDGNDRELQLYSVPEYLVLRPHNGTVSVSLLSPTEIEGGDDHRGVTVPKEELVHGIVDAVEAYYTALTDVDTSLKADENVSELLATVDSIRETAYYG